MTVTGMTIPLGPNTWVMPTFLPNNAFSIILSTSLHCNYLWSYDPRDFLQFDLDVHACGQIQTCQCLYRFVRRINNINQAFVRANFELLSCILIDKRRAHNRVLINLCRQWYRS